MMRHYKIEEKRFVESDEGSGQVVVVIAPDVTEQGYAQQQFRLDDYDLASTLDPDEVPRLELIDGRMLLIWKLPFSATVADNVELGVGGIGLAFANDRLLFCRAAGEVSFKDREFRNVGGTTDAMLAFLLRTVRHFVGHLRVIKQISSELERKVTVSMENRHLLQMFSLSENLVYYVDAIEGNAAVLTKLRSFGSQIGFQARHLEILDDIILENSQAARQANIYSSILSGLMDARGTIVNNNMNVLLKNLTLINIVFLPLNLIASIGGMSEWSVMTKGLDWRISYSLFCLAMVAIGWATWMLMKRVIERRAPNTDEGQPGAPAMAAKPMKPTSNP
ncbi:MAG: magnesium transporter CorA family protein [Desulfobacterales bacterium]|nr:magnesium transporter CorA family protein [Desulfobacterales bacterium]